jgi:hypothetical protein
VLATDFLPTALFMFGRPALPALRQALEWRGLQPERGLRERRQRLAKQAEVGSLPNSPLCAAEERGRHVGRARRKIK